MLVVDVRTGWGMEWGGGGTEREVGEWREEVGEWRGGHWEC